MTVDRLIEKLKEIEDFGMQSFWDKEFEGGCPCFNGERTVEGKTIEFWGRCWRVPEYGSQDLHVAGTMTMKDKKRVVKEVKRALDAQNWYNTYKVIYD